MAQLTLDGIGSRPSDWTPAFAEALSNDIARASDMTIFFGPQSHEYGPLLLCFTMIAESHISLHLDRASGMAWVDVFTCRDMDPSVETLVRDRLRIEHPTIHRLDRGDLSAPVVSKAMAT